MAVLGVIPWTRGVARSERLRAMGALAAAAALRTGIGMNLPLTHRAAASFIAACVSSGLPGAQYDSFAM